MKIELLKGGNKGVVKDIPSRLAITLVSKGLAKLVLESVEPEVKKVKKVKK